MWSFACHSEDFVIRVPCFVLNIQCSIDSHACWLDSSHACWLIADYAAHRLVQMRTGPDRAKQGTLSCCMNFVFLYPLPPDRLSAELYESSLSVLMTTARELFHYRYALINDVHLDAHRYHCPWSPWHLGKAWAGAARTCLSLGGGT